MRRWWSWRAAVARIAFIIFVLPMVVVLNYGLTAGANFAQVLSVVVAAVSLLASLFLAGTASRESKTAQAEAAGPPSLSDKIDSLRLTLSSSGELIAEITGELELQTAALERIRAEAEENQRLAALNKEEAEAVRKLVERTIEGAQVKASKLGSRQQRRVFVAGLLFAIPVGVAGNFAFELVKAWLAT